MLGLGRLPREYIYRYAERQLFAVRRRIYDVIGRLGVTSRTRQKTWRFRQGYSRLSGSRRRFHYNRDAVPGLALHVPAHVLS